jgi:hypothetical protein
MFRPFGRPVQENGKQPKLACIFAHLSQDVRNSTRLGEAVLKSHARTKILITMCSPRAQLLRVIHLPLSSQHNAQFQHHSNGLTSFQRILRLQGRRKIH